MQESRPGGQMVKEEDVVSALWQLRNQLLESTCNMAVERPNNATH